MSDVTTGKRRDFHDIIIEILKTAKEGVRKTPLMYKTRLSFAQVKKYLYVLEKAGLIVQKSNVWKTTEKGLDVIEFCELCCRLVEEVP